MKKQTKSTNKITKTCLKATNLLAPVCPALVSCADKNGKQNALTVAWIGTVNSKPPMLSISISPLRYSHHLIDETKEFVVNLPSSECAEQIDFCGVKSGSKLDKLAHCGFTSFSIPSLTYAQGIKELPVNIACKVTQQLDLGSHTMFLAEISEVHANTNLFDSNGKLHLEKAHLLAYMHGEYFALADKQGFFGYSLASKDVLARRLPSTKKRTKAKNGTLSKNNTNKKTKNSK